MKITTFVGPLLGGVFTDKITWRWCFYINLPFGAVTIVSIMVFLQNPEQLPTNKTFKERLKEVDFVGPIVFIPAMVCLLLILQWGGVDYAWGSPIIISLFVGFGVLGIIWIYSQYRLGERATIPFRLAIQRTVFWSSLSGFFSSAAFTVPVFYLPLYFQAVKENSATQSAVNTIPMFLAVTIATVMAGVSVQKVGYCTPFIIAGAALLAIGTGLMSLFEVDTSVGQSIGYQVVFGIGAGINNPVFIILSHLTGRYWFLPFRQS